MDTFTPDQIERLVEQITKHVLIALREEERRAKNGDGSDACQCKDGVCVRDCADRVQQVIGRASCRERV